MKPADGDGNVAVLIDADNVSHKIVAGLMAEVVRYGNASVRRIYGDWTSPLMKGWRECLLEYSIIPIQQFAYTTGKNATDGAMIIDAMDLLYTGRFSAFCLVSSDSDFTRLAARIREQGIPVYGFGNRANTHKAFVAACNEFVYFDAFSMIANEPVEETSIPTKPESTTVTPAQDPQAGTSLLSTPPTSANPLIAKGLDTPPRPFSFSQRPTSSSNYQYHAPGSTGPVRRIDFYAKQALRLAITQSTSEEDYANLAAVGLFLLKISPDLTPRNYGFQRLREFVEASGIVELKMKSRDRGPPIALVRLKS